MDFDHSSGEFLCKFLSTAKYGFWWLLMFVVDCDGESLFLWLLVVVVMVSK